MSCGYSYDNDSGGGSGIPDAPSDGNRYGRKDGAWEQIDSIDNANGTAQLDADGNLGVGAAPTTYGVPGFRVLELAAATLAEFIISIGGTRIGSLLATTLGFNGLVLSSDSDDLSIAANTTNQILLRATGEVEIPNLNEGQGDFGVVWDSGDGEVRRSEYTPQQLGQIQRVSGGTVTYFDTIAAALAVAVSGDTVFVPVGTHSENLTVPAGVALVGMGGENGVRILGSGATGTRISLAAGAEAKNLVVFSAPNSDPAISFAGDAVVCRDIRLVGASASSVGFAPNTSQNSLVKGLFTSGTFDMVFDYSGACNVFVRDHVEASTAATTHDISNASARVVVASLKNHPSASLTSNIKIDSPCQFYIENSLLIEGVSYPIELTANSDGCKLEFNGCLLNGTLFDWFVDPAAGGTGTDISMTGSEVVLEKVSATQSWLGTIDPAIFILDKGATNDRGFRFMGEVSVGIPGRGFEFVTGEGDSSTLGMTVLTTDSTFTSFTDVTAQAAPDDAATFTFEGVAAGHCIVFGAMGRTFPGLKTNATRAAVLGGGEMVWEFWDITAGGGSGGWTEIDCAAQGGSGPDYDHRSNDFWETLGQEQVRIDPPADWAETMLDGTLAYWLRCRIDTAITTTPIFQRSKLGTNRIEFEGDGPINKYGTAERKEQLLWHRRLEDDESGSSPGNSTVNFSPSIGLTMVDNNFQNGANDANGGNFQLPEGLDTSRPLRFQLRWKPQNNNTGDVELQFTHMRARLGDTLDGTLPETTQVTTVAVSGQANEYLETEFQVRVADFRPADDLAFVYRRDATAGNLNDTFEANIQIVSTKIFGVLWS